MKDLFAAISLVIGTIILGISIILFSTFIGGFITYKFYGWFIQPVFAVPTITFLQACGIGFFLTLFKNSASKTFVFQGEEIKTKVDWSSVFVTPLIVFFIGYLFHLLIIF